MTIARKELGDTAEWLAAQLLQKQGFRIVERNYRLRMGEVDIIADNGDILCFVEVKASHEREFGHPAERVTASKQNKIVKVALAFLQRKPYLAENRDIRFDVVTVIPTEDADPEKWSIEHIEDAFRPGW